MLLSRPMQYALIIVVACSVSGFAFVAKQTLAQTSCLSFLSNSTPPSGYGASWDVTSPGKELLVKSNCPASGNSLDITIGKGNPSQFIWSKIYVYNPTVTPPAWEISTLAGTIDANGWVTSGSGAKTVTVPFTPTPANPFHFVGYVCTLHSSVWKCGCANAACTTKHWQLQAYKGNGGGTTGGTSGGSTGGTTGGTGGSSCIPEGSCIMAATPSDLQSKLDSATCGCTVKLADDTYGGTYTYTKNCPASNQVVIKSANPRGAKISGTINLAGAGAVLSRLNVDGGKVSVRGEYHRITRNEFKNDTPGSVRGKLHIQAGAKHIEIDRNDFLFSPTTNILFGSPSAGNETKFVQVHHNYFTGRTDAEGIFVATYAAETGRDTMLRYAKMYNIFEYNMFENYGRYDTIHIKALNNTVQNNYAKNSGTLSVRQGQYNTIKANYLENTRIGVHEESNQLLCNRLSGAKIMIFAGEGGLTRFGTYQSGTAKDTLVSGNIGTLVLGEIWGLGGRTVPDEPALRTEVRGHTGEIVERFHRDSSINVHGTPACEAPSDPPITREQVGINSPCN